MSNKPHIRKFEFADGTDHDATVDESSLALESCYKYGWNITPITTGLTGGTPEYTVEVSNDNINWFEYNNLSTDVSVDDAVCDDHLTFIYMRIVHQSKGATGGTVEYVFTQKQV